MIFLNFSHPLTDAQRAQIERLAGKPISRRIEVPVQFYQGRPFAEQAAGMVDQVGLSPEEWQSLPILVNPPSLNFIAAVLIAELHGRMGHFPPIVRMRPVPDALPPRYAAAEIIHLQSVRDAARLRRCGP